MYVFLRWRKKAGARSVLFAFLIVAAVGCDSTGERASLRERLPGRYLVQERSRTTVVTVSEAQTYYGPRPADGEGLQMDGGYELEIDWMERFSVDDSQEADEGRAWYAVVMRSRPETAQQTDGPARPVCFLEIEGERDSLGAAKPDLQSASLSCQGENEEGFFYEPTGLDAPFFEIDFEARSVSVSEATFQPSAAAPEGVGAATLSGQFAPEQQELVPGRENVVLEEVRSEYSPQAGITLREDGTYTEPLEREFSLDSRQADGRWKVEEGKLLLHPEEDFAKDFYPGIDISLNGDVLRMRQDIPCLNVYDNSPAWCLRELSSDHDLFDGTIESFEVRLRFELRRAGGG